MLPRGFPPLNRKVKLPPPETELAGCIWLARLVAKLRVHADGALPFSYPVGLGSRVGIDGYFLRHFQLTLPGILAAVRRFAADEDVEHWFLRQPSASAECIRDWSQFAVMLGAPGHPGHRTLHLVKWFLCSKVARRPLVSIFEAIRLDEFAEDNASSQSARTKR
jgi:Domain of unknown function (DUF5069)